MAHDMAVARIEALSRLPQALLMWPSRKSSISILVTGRSHAGKSALINEIVGQKVANEGDMLVKGTDKVQGYAFKYTGLDLRITLWDSPGLQDGLCGDQKYLSDMLSHGCVDADLTFYCVNMNDTRFRQEDHDAIKNLTTGFGKRIWNNVIFVMTFANRQAERLERFHQTFNKRNLRDLFNHLLRSWKARLVDAVVNTGVSEEIAANIPVVPVGYKAERALPDRDDWLESLWYECVSRIQTPLHPMPLTSTHRESSKQLLDEAMKTGFIGITIILCVVLGPPGVGKTCLKYLLLDQRPPHLRSSTICAETPLRIEIKQMSEARIQSLKGNWKEVKGEEMFDTVAGMILLAERDTSSIGATVKVSKEQNSVLTRIVDWITKYSKDALADKKAAACEGGASDEVSSVACQRAMKKIVDKLVQSITKLKREEGQLEALSHPLTEQLLRSLWVYFSDCGGQPQYHELLPLFIQGISSALCVTCLTHKLDEVHATEYYVAGKPVGVPQQSQLLAKDTIQSLVNTIHSFSAQDKPPSIIMVGTHLDKLEEKMKQVSFSEASPEHSSDAVAQPSAQPPASERIETLEEKNKKLLEMLEPEFSDQLVYFSRHTKKVLFPLNTLERGEREKAMAHSIRHAVEKSGAREVKVPVWWYVLELLLQELAKELGRGVLSRAECLEMARLLNVREESFNAALVYFDELNVLKYFPNNLSNVVFVDSQIPLDKISELVYHSYLLRQPVVEAEADESSSEKPVTKGWMHFRDHSVVSEECLEQFPRHYVPGIFTKEHLSKLLTSLLVFAEIPPPDWVKDTSSAKQKYYVMLSLLPTIPESELEKYRVSSPIAATLLIRFPGGSRLAGVFCCFVTHLIRHRGWDLLLDSEQPLYRNCVRLQLLTDPPCTITLIDSSAYIEVHVDITAPVPHSEYACFFPIIRQAILSGIQAACIALKFKMTRPELAFVCPHASPFHPLPSTDQPEQVKQHTATLTRDKKHWHCDCDPLLSGVLDEHHSIWFRQSQAPQDAAAHQNLPSLSINDPSVLDATPTLAKLAVLQTSKGTKIKIIESVSPFWQSLGSQLEFDESGSKLELIKANHFANEACCRTMFQHWLKGNGVKPCSWRKLIELIDDLDQEVLVHDIQTALLESAK